MVQVECDKKARGMAKLVGLNNNINNLKKPNKRIIFSVEKSTYDPYDKVNWLWHFEKKKTIVLRIYPPPPKKKKDVSLHCAIL